MAIIDKPSDYFNTVLYTGTGSSNAITGVEFQPDFVWIKQRSNAENHAWFDAVRGVTKYVKSDETASEVTESNSLSAFGTDGFTVVSSGKTNTNGRTYASWNWLGANGTASNSNGNITSTVSANTTAGFSIVSWTGNNSGSATVGHGLGAVPNVVIIKKRDGATNWGFKHSSFASGAMSSINTTDAPSNRNGSTAGGIGDLTSSTTFGFIGGGAGTPSENNGSMIAYCFADVRGYSKFGSFIGNGDADGSFIFTGFKVAWLLIKRINGNENYAIFDSKRLGYNVKNYNLRANQSNAEGTDVAIDILSNGFKIRSTSSGFGGASGGTYAYMAFAENPFVTSTGVPATAR